MILRTHALAHLLKYDSLHSIFNKTVQVSENGIVDGKHTKVLHHGHPSQVPWFDHNVDIVVEASGKFKIREDLEQHIKNGAK